MTSPSLTLSSVIFLTLCACEPPKSADPAAGYNENLIINSVEQPKPQAERPLETGQSGTSGSADQEPKMPQSSSSTGSTPAKSPIEPPAKPVATPSRRVILPSPTQPPAEIDPVQPYPGDEVPR